MKLLYHTGNNFGDKLNVFIFNHYLPNFFDDDESVNFIGIGTILGLYKVDYKKIVFSSGASDCMFDTYGQAPTIDDTYDIVCVRGPLTCHILGIPIKYCITDGAALLYDFHRKEQKKYYDYSYIPHVGSEDFFKEMKILCKDLGINYISPTEPVETIINKIGQSKLVIAEAMHGAIVADSLRVPWIAVKMFKTINEFKWRDWCMSLELDYDPYVIESCFDKNMFIKILKNKFPFIPSSLFLFIVPVYHTVHRYKTKKIKKQLIEIKDLKTMLSNENLLNEKVNMLKKKLIAVKIKYDIVI